MRICSGSGCLRSVPDDVRFCDECASERPAQQSDRHLDPFQQQYKTARWVRFRKQVLIRHPFCAVCQRAPSRIADHIIPARVVVEAWRAERISWDMWAGFYILDNTHGLCHACHQAKTAAEPGKDWSAQLTALMARFKPKSLTG